MQWLFLAQYVAKEKGYESFSIEHLATVLKIIIILNMFIHFKHESNY
jgi:hypothetical protein